MQWPVGLLAVFILVVAAGVFCLGINRRAMPAWKRYRPNRSQRRIAQLEDNLPPPAPPDAENFGVTPCSAPSGRKGKVDPVVWGVLRAWVCLTNWAYR